MYSPFFSSMDTSIPIFFIYDIFLKLGFVSIWYFLSFFVNSSRMMFYDIGNMLLIVVSILFVFPLLPLLSVLLIVFSFYLILLKHYVLKYPIFYSRFYTDYFVEDVEVVSKHRLRKLFLRINH